MVIDKWYEKASPSQLLLIEHAIVVLVKVQVLSIHSQCGWSREPICVLQVLWKLHITQLRWGS